MQIQTQAAPPTLVYLDRADVPETFADSVENIVCDGTTIRMEFVVNRLEAPKPSAPPKGRKVTAARLVLPITSVLGVASQLNVIIDTLKKQGVVKDIVPKPTPRKAN